MFSKTFYKNISINSSLDNLREPLLVISSQQEDIKKETDKSEDLKKSNKILFDAAYNLLVAIKNVYKPCLQAWLMPQHYLKNALAQLPGLHENFKKALEHPVDLKIDPDLETVLYNLRSEASFLKRKMSTQYIEGDKDNEIRESTQVLAAHLVLSIESFKPKPTYLYRA